MFDVTLLTVCYVHDTIECKLVQCACADESSTICGVDHTPHCRPRAAAQTHRVMLTLLERRIYHHTIPYHDKEQTTSRFVRLTILLSVGYQFP